MCYAATSLASLHLVKTKRACSDMNLEEEVVDLSGGEREHWCQVSVCVPASVLTLTDLFSLVNVVCDVVVSCWDCEFVELQTSSLSSERDAGVSLECETKMNFEAPPVKAVPEAVRNRPTPQCSPPNALPE